MSSVDRQEYESLRMKTVMKHHNTKKEIAVARAEAEAVKRTESSIIGNSYRTCLPAFQVNRKDISIWGILKSCIGKDLTRMVFPVVLNEPISLLQRLSEYMEYSYLLDKAAKADNAVERCEFVAAFVTSTATCNWMRPGKPFNPLLGETYELTRKDMGFRWISEQVSHHPPITAFYADGRGWEFHGSITPRLNFWGKSIDVTPKGILTVDLHKYNESYSWQNVHCYVHNILVGEVWMELHGQITVTCNKSDVKAVLHYKETGWYSKDLHFVEGHIYTGKRLDRVIYGSWVKGMYACSPEAYDKFNQNSKNKTKLLNELKAEADKHLDVNAGLPVVRYNFKIPGQRMLWEAHEQPSNSHNYYNFSYYAMALNEWPKDGNKTLNVPPTDSRFRPDQRLFEEGNIKEAEAEKVRLETAQRRSRVEGLEVKPLWFKYERLPSTGKEDWVLDKSYFKRSWSKCPNIFR